MPPFFVLDVNVVCSVFDTAIIDATSTPELSIRNMRSATALLLLLLVAMVTASLERRRQPGGSSSMSTFSRRPAASSWSRLSSPARWPLLSDRRLDGRGQHVFDVTSMPSRTRRDYASNVISLQSVVRLTGC